MRNPTNLPQSREYPSANWVRFFESLASLNWLRFFENAHRGVAHHGMAHRLGGHSEEVGPVFEVLFRSTRQSQIDFVDYSRGLQSMARILLGHVALRHLVQLAVHERHEPVERGPVTLAPLDE